MAKKSCEKKVNLSKWENPKTRSYHVRPTLTQVNRKVADSTKCWQRCESQGTSWASSENINCVNDFGETVWQWLWGNGLAISLEWKMHIPYQPVILHQDKYPGRTLSRVHHESHATQIAARGRIDVSTAELSLRIILVTRGMNCSRLHSTDASLQLDDDGRKQISKESLRRDSTYRKLKNKPA